MNSNIIKQLAILLVVLAIGLVCQAQAPPTLSAGLAGLTGSKGSIDIELLSEIISEKQAELKKEGIKVTMGKAFQNRSFALYNYAHGTVHTLLEYENKSVIEKELLENTMNLAMVYSFTEAYLQYALKVKREGSELQEMKFIIDKLSPTNLKLFPALHRLDELAIYEAKIDYEIPRSWEKPMLTLHDYENIEISDVLLDLVFDVMLQNENLQSAGFIKIHTDLKADYDRMNLYKILTESDFLMPKTGWEGIKADLKNLHDRIESVVDVFAQHARLFYELRDNELSVSSLREAIIEGNTLLGLSNDPLEYEETLNDSLISIQIENIIGNAIIDLDNITPILQEKYANCNNNCDGLESLQAEFRTVMKGVGEFNLRIGEENGLGKISNDDIYFIRQVVNPFVESLVLKYGYPSYHIDSFMELEQILASLLTLKANKDIELLYQGSNSIPDNLKINHLWFTDLSSTGLMDLLGSLNTLDKISTYELIYRTLENIGLATRNDKASYYIKNVLFYLENFTEFDEENQQIDIDVEELMLHVFEEFQDREKNGWQVYLGIGMGTAFGQGPLLANDSIRNFSFASEKIGIKKKLIDFNRRRQFDFKNLDRNSLYRYRYRSDDPFVSDIYLLAYGSGLLYNVANSNTGEEIKDVFFGMGAGISFFNDLDFNVWMMSPSNLLGELQWKNIPYYGFTFDVKITEYLRKLGEKRKKNKMTEQGNAGKG